MYKTDNKGFTLIELLVVIAIIGLLSTVVFTSLNQARKKGRDGRRVQDINQIRGALELYYDRQGSYPTALSSLTAQDIPVIPKDPNTGNDYGYVSNGQDYVLYATLEDSNHKALDNDIDGNVTAGRTVNCNDPVYCVQP